MAYLVKPVLILVSWSLPKAPPAPAPYAHNAAPKKSGAMEADTFLAKESNDGSVETVAYDSQTKTTFKKPKKPLKLLKPLKRSH
jgi:hypothetical protein